MLPMTRPCWLSEWVIQSTGMPTKALCHRQLSRMCTTPRGWPKGNPHTGNVKVWVIPFRKYFHCVETCVWIYVCVWKLCVCGYGVQVDCCLPPLGMGLWSAGGRHALVPTPRSGGGATRAIPDCCCQQTRGIQQAAVVPRAAWHGDDEEEEEMMMSRVKGGIIGRIYLLNARVITTRK